MKKRWILAAALALVLAAGALWYVRPQTLEQLCPGLEIAQCQKITAHYYQADLTPKGMDQRLELAPGDGAFSSLLAQFQGRTFRRSLWGLLPEGANVHRSQPGDFQWELLFAFADGPLEAGGDGEILRVSDFYGAAEISFGGAQYRHVSTGDQDGWRSAVMAVLLEAGGFSEKSNS